MELLRYLVGHSGLSGALALSTCNRTELYVTASADTSAAEIVARLARYLDPAGVAHEHVAIRQGRDAVEHLFRVAAGLDSMLVGEAQVLGQVRSAHRLAQQAGVLDAELDIVARRALTAGRAVRHRTALGRVRGGLGAAAVDVAAERLRGLAGRTALLIGAGKVGGAAARALQRRGAHVRVLSRSGESAAQLAEIVGGEVATESQVSAEVDVIIASTDSRELVLGAGTVAELQSRRCQRPLLIIDLAVPRNVDAGVSGVNGVELIDIDGVGRTIGAASAQAVDAAESIVRSAVDRTMAIIGVRETSAPSIRELLDRAERLRLQELGRTLSRLPSVDPESRARIERMTESLVAKLLHPPISHLREVADDPAAVVRLRDAFDLDGGTEPATRQ